MESLTSSERAFVLDDLEKGISLSLLVWKINLLVLAVSMLLGFYVPDKE